MIGPDQSVSHIGKRRWSRYHLTSRMSPVSKPNIPVSKGPDVDQEGEEEAECKREDLEIAEIVLHFTIRHHAEGREDRKKDPKDEHPGVQWHLGLRHPVLKDQNGTIPLYDKVSGESQCSCDGCGEEALTTSQKHAPHQIIEPSQGEAEGRIHET